MKYLPLPLLFVVLFALAFALITLVPPAKGECYSRPRVVVSDYHAPVVKKVIVEPVAVAVAVPAYFAAYIPPAVVPAAVPAAPAAPQPAAQPSELQAVADALRQINSRLDRLEKGAPAPATPPARPGPADPFAPKDPAKGEVKAPPSGLNVLLAKCASCHESKVAADKGGSLTLLEGALLAASLTERDKRRVMAASYAGRMPPKSSGVPALTDEEVGAVVQLFDR